MTKHKSEDYKLSAVKDFLENKDTQENTCKIFKCSVRSLLRWTKRYEEENEIKRHISRIIKENYISLKLTKIRHEPIKRFGKDINIKEKIKDFYNEIKKI